MTTDECFITVYGALRRHTWLHPEELSEDPWSLFRTYTELLMWANTETASVGARGEFDRVEPLWDVYEAGGDWSDDLMNTAGHVLWAQAGLSNSIQQICLPIAQLGFCAEKTINRIGFLTLSAVQMILPLGFAPVRQPQATGIFGTADSSSAFKIRVEIDGSSDSFIENADKIIDEANSRCMNYDISFSRPSVIRDASILLREPEQMSRNQWLGANSGKVRTTVSVVEFSIDTCSFLISQIALACQLHGVADAVLITLLFED